MSDPLTSINISKGKNGIATVALARPRKRNALSSRMIDELATAAVELHEDKSVRVVILAGEGRTFCAGADLDWMRDQFDATEDERRREAMRLARMLNGWNSLNKPVIARVHGDAYGGGVGLMAVADVAIGVPSARFGLTEVRLGLIPSTISPYVVAKTGQGAARHLFMSGEAINASEALNYGLLTVVVDSDQLDERVMKLAGSYLNCAPGACADAKKLALSFGPGFENDLIERTVDSLVNRWGTPEASEGVAAFFERRKPSWSP